MFFRKPPPSAVLSSREKAWFGFAKSLDLEAASGSIGMMRMLLNEPVSSIQALYRTEVLAADQSKLRLFFLDYEPVQARAIKQAGPLVSVCMLVVAQKSFVSLKASRKPHKVMEKLGASASGGVVVPFEESEFSDKVTVYSRDIEAVQKLLHGKARDILHRALYDREIAPTFLLGEKVLLFSHLASAVEPTPLPKLELLATDLLSLYAAFLVKSDE
jgi:hypothetical protein